MTLLDEIRGAASSHGTPCTVGAVIAQFGGGDLSDLLAALRSDIYQSSAIARVLTDRTGEHISAQSVRRHRRGECRCPR